MGLIFRGTDDTIKADDGSLTIEGLAGQFPSGIEVGTAATIKTNGNATFSGIVTATSFVGSGADLTGIDATSIKDSSGNVKAQGNVGGIVVTGVVTSTGGFSGDGSGLTGVASTDNIQTATDATFLANVSIGGSLTVDGTFTKINTTILDVEDKTVGVASTSAKSATTQDDAGLVMYGQTDVNLIYEKNKASVGLNTGLSVTGIISATGTGAIKLPEGTTAQRPTVDASQPYIRFNSTLQSLEFYNGNQWVSIITDYFPSGSLSLN